jgi:hypothetical protein
MKLMIVGSDKIYAIENFYCKHLAGLGVDVLLFPAQSIFYDYYQTGIGHKIAYRAGVSSILKKINQQFKEKVLEFQPGIIWVFKGMELYPGTLRWAKKQGIKLVNFNGDSPFFFSGTGSGNKNVTKSAGLYDLHFTYDKNVKKEMEARYSMPAILLPFGFDISETVFRECCALPEIMRVCFLGNPDVHRGKFLQQLAENRVPLDLYGNGWEKYVTHPSVNIYPPVYAVQAWKTLRRYRVQLNLMRPHNPHSHNMRTFELGGVGAVQLAPATEDHKKAFKPEEEIFIFHDMEESIQQIRKIHSLPNPAADRISTRVRERSIQSGYSYQCRSRQALDAIKEYLG